MSKRGRAIGGVRGGNGGGGGVEGGGGGEGGDRWNEYSTFFTPIHLLSSGDE